MYCLQCKDAGCLICWDRHAPLTAGLDPLRSKRINKMSKFYQKGRIAAQRGVARENNPYVQPYARREWFDGWETANAEMDEAAEVDDWSKV